MSIADVIGILGAIAVLAAYLLLQLGRLGRNGLTFLLLNAFGSAGILFSLAFRFNLSATLIEAAWLTISIYGLVRRAAGSERAS
ncbi:MAG: CBU_0592 family membrane protein [Gammaproteobacteria bacterium]